MWPSRRRDRDYRLQPTPSHEGRPTPDWHVPAPRRRRSGRRRPRPGSPAAPPSLALTLWHHLAPACAACIQSLSLMDKTGIHPGGEGVQAVAHGHDPHHDELGFWRKYVFSVDHKVIGIQYAITGLL